LGAIVDSITPLFAVISLGFFAGRAGSLGEGGIRGLGAFVLNFAIPPHVFRPDGRDRARPDRRMGLSRRLFSGAGADPMSSIAGRYGWSVAGKPAIHADGEAGDV
jgi:hypothetical protein